MVDYTALIHPTPSTPNDNCEPGPHTVGVWQFDRDGTNGATSGWIVSGRQGLTHSKAEGIVLARGMAALPRKRARFSGFRDHPVRCRRARLG